jgi:hypothetical protein
VANLKPCRAGHVAPRDANRRCKECRRIADANRKERRQQHRHDPTNRGTCSACGTSHRALNAFGRCVQGCDVGRRQRVETLARMQILNDLVLSITDRLWQSSMSWERDDLRNELQQAQAELARLARYVVPSQR